VRAATERRADVPRERADVGPLAAPHVDRQQRRRPLEQVEPLDRHRARLALHRDPGAGQLVQAPPLVVQRGVHRRHLHDRAAEARQQLLDLPGVARRHIRLREHRALGVVGGGGDAEAHRRQVALASLVLNVLDQAGGRAERHHQHSGGRRIQRPRVADSPLPGEPANPRHHVVGGDSGGLVDVQEAVHCVLGGEAFGTWRQQRCAAAGECFAPTPRPRAPVL
jgi:hypothetical protein